MANAAIEGETMIPNCEWDNKIIEDCRKCAYSIQIPLGKTTFLGETAYHFTLGCNLTKRETISPQPITGVYWKLAYCRDIRESQHCKGYSR